MADTPERAHLTALYGEAGGAAAHAALWALLERYPRRPAPVVAGGRLPLSERDALLITYGDQVRRAGEPPLRTLAEFCERHLRGVVSGVHLLPFYPYTSDDGFSVVDYQAVDPALGDWDDVAAVGRHFRLMFDAVINHISASSEWFQAFLRDEPRYRDFFITVEGEPDLSQVVRPRALPLLTPFETATGTKQVWTTFSADQVDLNYANPQVLLAVLDTILFYAAHGADFVRLDAIAYLWKQIGTPSIHLPETHRVIQLMRAVLDSAAPDVMLITETNVPHAENVAYFGDGTHEAQLVYNFALPPLTLHAFHTGSAAVLTKWAAGLTLPSRRTTFFNFLASHDGVGVNPARGLLSAVEIDLLVEGVVARGGLASYKHNPDGSQSVYELNVNYFDALAGLDPNEAPARQVDRFIASQAIMLALIGVPGLYFHSLFGSRGWPAGVALTQRNRTVNREKLEMEALERELTDPGHRRHQVFTRYAALLRARAAWSAFDPLGDQQVPDVGEAVFAVLRRNPGTGHWALCAHNVSDQAQSVSIDRAKGGLPRGPAPIDLIDGRPWPGDNDGRLRIELSPYQVVWLGGAAQPAG
jgi:glucosylglycerate phosphorylase